MNKSSTASASSSTEDTQDLPLLVLAIGQGTPELENGGLAFFNVDTTDQAIEMLDRRDPDIILIHAHELGEDTLHWVALLHQHAQRVPIVLAVKDDQDYLIGEAMRRGAADYVPLEDLTTPRFTRRMRLVWRNHHWRTPGLVGGLLKEQDHQHQKMEGIARLAGGIAHDFNNLLTPILGFAHMISDEAAPHSTVNEFAAEILRAAERASDLNKSLLAFSRKRITQKQPVHLHQLVESMIPRVAEQLTDKHRLDVQLDASVSALPGDETLLEQVILSLIHNAIQAMPRGGSLTLATDNVRSDAVDLPGEVASASDTFILLTIKDTGAGITQENQDKVFEPFYTTRELGQGHGLGLSMAYGIVESHNGFISVSSQPNLGTSFRIYLPVTSADIDTTDGNSPLEALNAEGELPTGSETVMVVDDERSVRELAARILESLGYHVLIAENGGDALMLMEKHADNISLILTDMVMPRMDGERMVERLRKVRPDFRVLYTSGYAVESDIGDLSNLATNFIPKPYSRRKLAHAIRHVLDRD